MADIVDLLRQRADIDQFARSVTVTRHVLRDAADEIERLQADRDLLVGVLRMFAVTVHSAPGDDNDQHWLGCKKRHPNVTAAKADRLRTLLDQGGDRG